MAPPPDPGIEAYFKQKGQKRAAVPAPSSAPDPGIEAYFKQKRSGAFAPTTREEQLAPIGEAFPFEVAQKATEDVIGLLDSTNMEDLRGMFAEAAKAEPGYDAATALDRTADKVEAFYKNINSTAGVLEAQAQALAATDPKMADKARSASARLREAIDAHQSGEVTPGRLAAKAKSAGVKGLNAMQSLLDTSHREVTRRLTDDALDPTRKPGDPVMSDEEWTRRMKEQYPTAANIAGATLGLPIALGAGALASGAALGVDAAVNLKQRFDGVPAEERQGPSLEGLKDIFKGTFESGKDFGLHMATDPLTPLSFAGGSVKESIGRQVGLAGRAAGKSAQEIEAATRAVEGILARANPTRTAGGMAQGTRAALLELERRGFTGALGAFGSKGERFGKGGIGVSIPLTEKRIELGDLVGAVSPKAGLALEAPLTRAGAAIDRVAGTMLVDPAADAARAMQQRAIGVRDRETVDFDERALKVLREKASAAGLTTPKAWDDYVRNTLDPAHTLRELAPNEAVPAGAAIYDVSKGIGGADEPKLVRLLDRVSEGFPEDIRAARKTLEAALEPNQKILVAEARPGFVPIQDRPRALQEFDAAYRQLMDDNFAKLQQGGVLDAPAKNLLTGAYVPRQYGRMFDWLDELNVTRGGKMGGANAFKERTGRMGQGLELGNERVYSGPPPRLTLPGQLRGKVQGETNLANVLPTYNRQAATSIAKESMFEELRRSGLALRSTAQEVKDNPHLFRDIGKDRVVPAKLYGFVEQVFENKPINLARIARELGAEATPAGRAAVKMFEAAAKMEAHWKAITLKWRPGYHALNVVNDTQYLIAMGATPNDLWRAANAMRGKGPGLKFLAEAKRYGIGASFGARAEALGVGVGRQKRVFNRVAAGKTKESLTESMLGAPERLGDAWSDTSRVAGYIARRRLGDSPAKAADAVRRGMIDYGTSTKFLQALRFFMPFATFQLRGPAAALRHAVSSPRTVIGSMRAARALGGERDPAVEPRQYWADRGQLVPLSQQQEGYFNEVRSLFGAAPTGPGEQPFVLARDAFQDPFTMPLQTLATQRFDSFSNSMSPWLRMGVEGLAKRNMLVDKPLAPTAAPVNAGVPWWAGALQGGTAGLLWGESAPAALAGAAVGGALAAGDWAEADPTANINGKPVDQVGWLQHYFGGFAPPIALPTLNAVARENMGQRMGPPTPMSAWRSYDPAGDPAATTAGQAISTLTGFPVAVASPGDRLYNATSSPEWNAGQAANLRMAEMLRMLEVVNARAMTR